MERLVGYARARIEEGRLTWLGETDVDWNGSETVCESGGVVVVCTACGHEWIYPELEIDG